MVVYRCWAEVDLSALRGNLAWIRHRAGPGVKIITVVKADGAVKTYKFRGRRRGG